MPDLSCRLFPNTWAGSNGGLRSRGGTRRLSARQGGGRDHRRFVHLNRLNLNDNVIRRVPTHTTLRSSVTRQTTYNLRRQIARTMTKSILFTMRRSRTRTITTIHPRRTINSMKRTRLPIRPPKQRPTQSPSAGSPYSHQTHPYHKKQRVMGNGCEGDATTRCGFTTVVRQTRPPTEPSV